MRKLILTTIFAVHLLIGETQAGWFSNKDQERVQQLELQLAGERQSKGNWQLMAGVLAVSAVVLFTVGAALGSRVRRHGTE